MALSETIRRVRCISNRCYSYLYVMVYVSGGCQLTAMLPYPLGKSYGRTADEQAAVFGS
jgi:hypothetical protein